MKKTKIILAVIGVIAVAGLFFPTAKPATKEITKEIVKEVRDRLGGVTNFDELGLGNGVISAAQRLEIASGTSTASWQNTTGEIVFIDYSELYVPAKASSTMRLFMNISTSTADVDTDSVEYTIPVRTQLLWDVRYATSTYGVASTNNGAAARYPASGVWSYSTSTAAVYPLQYVVMSIMSDSNTCSGPNVTSVTSPTGSSCEQASSTRRGFNPTGTFKYHYYATTTPRL